MLNDLPESLVDRQLTIEAFPAQNLPEKYVEQLIEKSKQPQVVELDVRSDYRGRFASKENYWQWAETKKRDIFLLLNEKKELAGIIWSGVQANESIGPEYTLTFGVRLYEGYIGHGLSKPFLFRIHQELRRKYPDQFVWLETNDDNQAALKTYKDLGYKELNRRDNRIIMGKPL